MSAGYIPMAGCGRNPRGDWTQVALRAALLASLWQAPIPWLHAHVSGADDSAEVHFKEHLLRYHRPIGALPHDGATPGPHSAVTAQDVVRELGWHVHFALPEDLFGLPCERDDSSRPISAAFCEPGTASAAPVRLIGVLHGCDLATWHVLPPATSFVPATSDGAACRPAGNYFDTFRDSASISVLICVARC